jgi:DNA repair protein RecO
MAEAKFERVTGIPLAAFRARGDSRVIALFTEEAGQVRMAARGSRKKGASSQPGIPLFSTCDFLLAKPQKGGDLFELREREPRKSRPGLNSGKPFESWAAASVLGELLLKTTQPHESQPYLFRMLDKALDCLEEGAPPRPLLIAFLVKYLEHAGFGLRLDTLEDGTPVDTGTAAAFDAATGGLCGLKESDDLSLPTGRASSRRFWLLPSTREALKKFRLAVFNYLGETPIADKEAVTLIECLAACIEFHLETHLKSLIFWQETLNRKEAPR